MLHIQFDGLIAAAEERSSSLLAVNSSAATPQEHGDHRGFTIAMVGDSTMRVREK